MQNYILLQIFLLIHFAIVESNPQAKSQNCPQFCSCESKYKQDSVDGIIVEKLSRFIKAKCNRIGNNIENLQKIYFGELATDIIQLDLSKNQLTKLDPSIFSNLTNLKRLDLSSNLLHSLDKRIFANLASLERLIIAKNLINTIPFGTFRNLHSLKQLDISENPLTCDCDLMWIMEWVQNTSVKLTPGPKCINPPDFKGISLKKLRIGVDMHCETPITQQNHVQLSPGYNQVVFEGDPMRLHCLIGSKYSLDEKGEQKTSLTWGWTPHSSQGHSLDSKFAEPTSLFPEINIVNRYLSDSGIIDSQLGIDNVHRNQSGRFTCQMISERMNVSKSLNLIVISKETKYCRGNITTNNKGIYTWPATVVGNKVILKCQGKGNGPVFATHFCDLNGRWQELNTKDCSYVNEITKILEQFAKVNLSLTRGSVIESARVLRNLTSVSSGISLNIDSFNDPVDIIFVSQTIHNYIDYLNQEKELGAILIDVVSHVMKFSRDILRRAQQLNDSCTEIVSNLEIASTYTPSLQTHKSNLAIEEFRVSPEGFSGMTCSWHSVENTRVFHCSTSNRTILHSSQHELMDALIQIPSSVLKATEFQTKTSSPTQRLLVAMFENNNFFPVFTTNTSDIFDVTSCVVGVKLDNRTFRNLSEPVQIMLRVPKNQENIQRAPTPVWWDPELLSGRGGWTTQGCRLSHETNGLFVFNCDRIGYYALMENIYAKDLDSITGAKFRLLHPAIYLGSFIHFICLLISIVTYITCFSFIQMPRKAKHTLINTWISMLFLNIIFTLSIYQTENQKLCQSVGIIQHYLFLSSLLWISVIVSDMYKRIKIKESILPDLETPIPKPIIGLYLLGYGVSLIICGISGAINMRQYASYNFCFLSNIPALIIVFVPMIILILFIVIMFLVIYYVIKHEDILGQISEGTQVTENVDIELLEPNIQNILDSVQSISTPTEMDDQENSTIIQLKSHVIILFLHLCMWLTVALSIIKPFSSLIDYDEDIFSILYCVIASILGVFVIFFYNFARSDVRNQWENMHCCIRRQWCRPRLISDATSNNKPQQINLLIPLQPISNQEAAALALSQSLHNSSNKNMNTNSITGSRDLNNDATKVSNLIHRKQYLSNNSPIIRSNNSPISIPENAGEMFYNPNQSNVARKFFKKQKRNVKRNNLEIMDGANSDGGSVIFKPRSAGIMTNNIFGTSSKVNNTNIHIEPMICTKELYQQNLNVLSDSCTDSDFIGRSSPQAIQFIIGSEGMHVSMKNKTKHVANIYTNVPETVLPEHQKVPLMIDEVNIDDSLHDSRASNKSVRSESSGYRDNKINLSQNVDNVTEINSTTDLNIEDLDIVHDLNNTTENPLLKDIKNRNKSRSLETFDDICKMPKSNTFTNADHNIDNYTKSESPVLFSPSLCDIYDLPTPSNKSPYPRASSPLLEDFINYEPGFQRSSNQSPNFDIDSNYAQYPISEMSIKSHGLYAPQPEISGNELNYTLINEADLTLVPNFDRVSPYGDFHYEPSEVSAISSLTNENRGYNRDSKTYQNCSPFRVQSSVSLSSITDSLINTQNQDYEQIHSTSIDDLYEQIKRRPNDVRRRGSSNVYYDDDKTKYTRSIDRDIMNACVQNTYSTKRTEYKS